MEKVQRLDHISAFQRMYDHWAPEIGNTHTHIGKTPTYSRLTCYWQPQGRPSQWGLGAWPGTPPSKQPPHPLRPPPAGDSHVWEASESLAQFSLGPFPPYSGTLETRSLPKADWDLESGLLGSHLLLHLHRPSSKKHSFL